MPVNFVFCIHNHQPVDNFDPVFVQAHDDSYKPFLDRIEKRAGLKFAAHFSGPLLEWLDKNRPEYLDRLKKLVEAGRLEILGGGFYEPIFTMLPDEDATGQITMMSNFIAKRFGRRPDGAWVPERVWEASLTPTLARAGVKYTVLDDLHFRAAGVPPSELDGAYLTEDRGEILRIFPIHEELRYSIPFKDPGWTIDYLQRYSDDAGRRTVVYADDGEKFGLWPNSKKHVYEEGWLDRFFDALEGAADRIKTCTFSEALEKQAATRRVYLPSTSYREMGEWSLPPAAQAEYESLSDELKRQNRFDAAKPLLQGGTWRGFKAKYPEANLMYGRMLHVSRKARKAGKPDALRELYRGQCNCGYWHGVFGGLHIPHLRGAIYRHLIASEKIVEGDASGIEKLDLDLDGNEDVRLYNPKVNAFITPSQGGHVVEFDARDAGVNLTASLARRKEHYHTKLRQATQGGAEAKSIHDVVVTKVENLDRHLVYDSHPRASYVDHFFAPDATLDDASKGWKEIGDFTTGRYEHRTESVKGEHCVRMTRKGLVGGVPVTVRKDLVLGDRGTSLAASYEITAEAPVEAIFGVEFNISMLSPDSPQAVLVHGDIEKSLSDTAEFETSQVSIRDTWYGLQLVIASGAATRYWTFPVRTVSQSESGFDLTYQSTVVMPTWRLRLEPDRPFKAKAVLGATR